MERSEPTLVPEWLRTTVTATGNSTHHCASTSHSDILSSASSTRHRPSRNVNGKDTPQSAFLDRSSASNYRRGSSSNGSSKHPYSSFNRKNRDKNRDKEKERSIVGDFWDNGYSDSLGDILISCPKKDALRRSQSMVCRKPSEMLARRTVGLGNGGSNNPSDSNDVLPGGSPVSSMQKASFEKDFPSLGNEEKQGAPNVGRVASPGLSTAVQNLQIGGTSFIGGEGWTSALAQVPTVISVNSMACSFIQQSAVATPSGISSHMAGLNMAEALSQVSPRASTAPMIPDKTQRLEELAIKQSRRLIPMTPSMPKTLAINSSDKSKPKTAVRTTEMMMAMKGPTQQLQSSQLTNHSLRGGQIRSDALRSTHASKFLVLKPVWENGVSSVAKDVSSTPTSNASRVASGQVAVASIPSTLKSPANPKVATTECKAAALALNPRSVLEKRTSLSQAQAQSRSDFFNLMRKKSSSAILQDTGAAFLSSSVQKSEEVAKENSTSVIENGSELTSNGDIPEGDKKNLCMDEAVYPDEEEAAFLRSLGWEENGDDEGLTEEEINAFYEECMKLRPSLKLSRGMQVKLLMISETYATGSGRASSELSTLESEIEA